MKTNFKRTSLALAMGLLGLGVTAQNAHAGAYTFADASVSLTLIDQATNTALDASQFSTLVVQNQSSTQADLGSVAGTSTNSSLVSGDSLQSFQVQTGPTPPAPENTFAPVGTGAWYARSDTTLAGQVITGLPNPGDNNTPATSKVISEISLQGTDIGQANANVSNNSGFVFTLAGDPTNPQTKTVRLDLSATTATQSSLHPNAIVPPSIAGSNHTWLVTITDNTLTGGAATVFSWTPDAAAGGISGGTELSDTIALNFGSSVSSAGADTGLITNSGLASALTPLLVTGRSYTFRIVETTSSNAQDLKPNVPEPSILGLMGIGLLGAGATWLRRTKAA